MNVVFYPVVTTEEHLIDLLSRSAWFLTFCPIHKIHIPIGTSELRNCTWSVAPGMDPAIADLFDKLRVMVDFVLVESEADLDDPMKNSSVILRWKKDESPRFVAAEKLTDWQRGKKVWTVDPELSRYEGSLYIEAGLYLIKNKAELIEKNRKKFQNFAQTVGRFSRAYLLATGPSVADYSKFDYRNSLNIVCNSVILDEKLMEVVKPQILVFADPIFHFGPSQYAATFRDKLLESIRKHNYTICIPFKYYGLFVSILPELTERTIGIPYTKDIETNFDLTQKFMLKTTSNILTFLMVPLATTFANEIGILGCDGRPLKEDTYFWNHNPKTQFNHKMVNIREVHPAFFNIDYNDYYLEHCRTLESRLQEGEKLGKQFLSLAFSHIPALYNRLGRGKRKTENDFYPLPLKALILDPDAKNWSGHYMAYNENLSKSLKDHGITDVKVLCRKDIDPCILANRPHYIPCFTEHSWAIANREENQADPHIFEKELIAAIEGLNSEDTIVFIYMYCGSIEFAKILTDVIKKMPQIKTNLNLFWLSFPIGWNRVNKDLFLWLDSLSPQLTCSVPTKRLQKQLAEKTGCILDVAPHPSTGVSDEQFQQYAMTKKYRKSTSEFTVLFPSAPTVQKGYQDSIDCVKLLASEPTVQPVIRHAPTPTTAKKFSQPLADMPANAKVIEGSLTDEEFEKLFSDADVVVLPYTAEDFSNRTSGLLIDATYRQLPSVVVEGTWLADFVHHYDCGVIVRDGSAEKLAEGILQLCHNFDFYQNKTKNAAKYYFSQNSWDQFSMFLLSGPLQDSATKPLKMAISGPYKRNTHAHWDETNGVARLFSSSLTGTTMIDVGACHGSALMPFLNKGWKIYAFEPDEKNRENLLKRLASHPKAANVHLDIRAVSNENKQNLAFYRSEESVGISGLSAFHSTHVKAQQVETVTLTDALADKDIKGVDFLKIDTEGHDFFVLQGFPWDRFKPAVIECEFEDSKTLPLGYTFAEMASFLVNKGYVVYVSEWHPIIRYGIQHDWNCLTRYPCELSNKKSWGNLLAFRDPIDEGVLIQAVQAELKVANPIISKVELQQDASKKIYSQVDMDRILQQKDTLERMYATEINRLQADGKNKDDHIAALRNSLSWRITLPLRSIGTLLHYKGKKPDVS